MNEKPSPLDFVSDVVEAFIRAAATQYASGVRQFWLFGSRPGDGVYDRYHAANRIRFAVPSRSRR